MRYSIDAEQLAQEGGDSIGRATNIIALFESLPPDFRREDLCRGCEHWDEAKPKPIDRPQRPGAHDASESCSGCLFAAVNPIPGTDVPRIGGRRFVREYRRPDTEVA